MRSNRIHDNMNEFNGFPESRRLFSRLVRHARLRQLQLLLALQHSGSVAKAAQHLDMSQSAATQALAELERVLELRLFERHSRGMRATQAGQALIDVARGVMNGLQNATETLAAIRLGANTSLRLGAIPAAAHAILGPLLGRFYALHRQVHVDVQEGEGALECHGMRRLFAGGGFPVFADRAQHETPGWNHNPLWTVLPTGDPA